MTFSGTPCCVNGGGSIVAVIIGNPAGSTGSGVEDGIVGFGATVGASVIWLNCPNPRNPRVR